jgi:hypothetical protein
MSHGTNRHPAPGSLASFAAEIAAPGAECVVVDAEAERRRRIGLIDSAVFAVQTYSRERLGPV